jgi:hypothetical protein
VRHIRSDISQPPPAIANSPPSKRGNPDEKREREREREIKIEKAISPILEMMKFHRRRRPDKEDDIVKVWAPRSIFK